MNPVLNPYTPNAGARPPALVGRDDLIRDFSVLLQRVRNGLTDKGLLVTGLRGVGKTVLLNEFREMAVSDSTAVIFIEISKLGEAFPSQFAHSCRQALFSISPRDKWKSRATDAAKAIASFSATFDPNGAVKFQMGVEAAEGVADSGEIITDLPDLVISLGEAARDHGKTIVILFDEIQYLSSKELSAVVMAKHQINQLALPIVISGAGLPILPNLTSKVQTYAERMFSFPTIGKLDPPEAKLALTAPAMALEVRYSDEAIAYIVDYTGGYPYFIQEFGKAVWNQAERSPITLTDAKNAQTSVDVTLDRDFFSVRVETLPEGEKTYLRALAKMGPGEHSQSEVAKQMGEKSSSGTGARVGRLIDKGLIYKSQKGKIAFTIPHFEKHVLRAI